MRTDKYHTRLIYLLNKTNANEDRMYIYAPSRHDFLCYNSNRNNNSIRITYNRFKEKVVIIIIIIMIIVIVITIILVLTLIIVISMGNHTVSSSIWNAFFIILRVIIG